MTFSIEEITTTSELATLEKEWTELCDRADCASPFQRPEWIVSWCRSAAPSCIWTLAVRSAGRLIALAPWLIYADGGSRAVGFLAGGVSDYHDLIVERGARDAVCNALFVHLEMRRDVWDECNFEELGRAAVLRDVRAPNHWAEERREQVPCPRLELSRLPRSLDAIVPSHQLARLRKYRRRAAKHGRLVLERASAASRVDALRELLRIHDARWATKGGVPAAPNPGFHEAVVAGFSRSTSSTVEIYRLKLDDQLLACLYGFVSRGVLYCYMQAFDPACAQLSPGVLLVGSVLEDAVARELSAVDFLRGTEPYKLAWGASGPSNVARRFRRLR